LHDRARLQAGHQVLVHAGAGGVGHVAIQLARLAGAQVATTVSSADKAEFVASLGANRAIRYRDEEVLAAVQEWTDGAGVDIAFDTVGGKVLESCFPCVKVYGDVVSILQPAADIDWGVARKRNLRFSQELMLSPVMLELEAAKRHQGEILRRGAELLDSGKLRVSVAQSFTLDQAAKAHDCLEQQHPMGKLVLTLE
jgi:NADPH2:quinone reductase